MPAEKKEKISLLLLVVGAMVDVPSSGGPCGYRRYGGVLLLLN